MVRFQVLIPLCALLAVPHVQGAVAQGLQIEDGARLVLIGDTFIEREQREGYLETALTSMFPDRTFTVRNLGWSGDTPLAESRGVFDPPAEGFRRMIEQVRDLEPTVIAICYGRNDAFAGAPGVERFREGMTRLLDALAPLGADLILVAPPPFETPAPPMPDVARHNPVLKEIAEATQQLAAARGLVSINLFDPYARPMHQGQVQPVTSNGIHPTPFGYWWLARGLSVELRHWLLPYLRHIEVAPDGSVQAHGANVTSVEKIRSGGLRITVLGERLPEPSPPVEGAPGGIDIPSQHLVRLPGLAEGNYRLLIDDVPVATATAEEWASGVSVVSGPEVDQVERLRAAIRNKNRLFFHRWRPQNDTYIYGFRKHEQGQNARETPMFDPLIAEVEAEIAGLRRPISRVYEIVPVSEGGRK